MKIAFLLPGARRVPSGGFKVVYEYANLLVADGVEVYLVYPYSQLMREGQLWEAIRRVLRMIYFTFSNAYKPYSWFDLDRRVKLRFVWTLREKYVPRADIYVATAVQTSVYLNDYVRVSPHNRFYLIQGFETWFFSEQKVLETYCYDLRKIVIAEWLQRKVESVGQSATLIHNGFDFSQFELTRPPIALKDKYCVTMLYHRSKLKGCDDGVAALELVRERFPQLRLRMFGVVELPSKYALLPWVEYFRQPDRELHSRIYNESAIFLAPSHSEGFALTPAEAMMCGSAVVCSDIGGHNIVCLHEQTALLFPMGDIRAMADSVIRLIEDDTLRLHLAENGLKYLKNFTWRAAYLKFRACIDTCVVTKR